MLSRSGATSRGLLAVAGAVAALPLFMLVSCSGDGSLPGAASSLASRASEAGSGPATASVLPSGSAADTTGPTEPADESTTAPPTSGPATVTRTSEVTRTATATATQTRTATITSSASETSATTTVVAEETAWYSSPWLWLVLLALAAVLVIVLVASSRHSSARNAWDRTFSQTGSDAQWLGETFSANLLTQANPSTLQGVLVSGLPRFDDTDRTLTQLASTAPDDARRGHANALRGALAELRQSLQHLVDVAAAGAPADTQRQAAGLVQQAQAQLRLAVADAAGTVPNG